MNPAAASTLNAAAAQTTGLTTVLLEAGAATSQTPLEAPVETARFEAAPPVHVPPNARPWLPAVFAGVAAMLPSTPALAQNHSLVETLVAAAPSWPPAWQLIIGGLLYLEPTIRGLSRLARKAASLVSRPAEQQAPGVSPRTLARVVNQVTGTVERYVAPLRDTAALGLGLYTGATVVFGSGHFIEHVPEAIALGLTLFNKVDRSAIEGAIVRHQLATGERLTPEGWQRQESQSLGILGPSVPGHFPQEDLVGEQPPRYADGVRPKRSLWNNVVSFWKTLEIVGVARRAHTEIEGWVTTTVGRLRTLLPGRYAPISGKYLAATDMILPQWALRYARTNKTTFVFHNREAVKTIPEGARKIVVEFNHDSLYLNFGSIWSFFPRARIIADRYNFHDNPFFRAFGISWFLDVIGLPFTDRPKPDDKKIDREAQVQAAAKTFKAAAGPNGNGKEPSAQVVAQADSFLERSAYGIDLAIFPQGGRVPRAYHEDGSLATPGIYSNVAVAKWPHLYFKNGFAEIAVLAANKSQESVYIPILLSDDGSGTHGSYYTAPKASKNAPFFQRNTTGQTVNVRLERVIEVKPGSHADEISRQVIEEAKRGLGIDGLLRDVIADWATARGQAEAGARFARWAEQGEGWYVLADRLRCIHPSLPERQGYRDRLFRLLVKESLDDNDLREAAALLIDVSATLKKTEYRNFK